MPQGIILSVVCFKLSNMGAWKLASLFLIGLLWVEAGGIEVKENYGDNKVRKTRQDPMGFGYSYNLYKPGVVASVTKEEIPAPAPVISSLHSASSLNSRSTLDQNNYYDKFPPTNQLSFSDESQDLLGKYQDFQRYENKYNDDESSGFRGYRPFKAEADYSAAEDEESQERPSFSRSVQPFNRGRPDRFNKEIDEAFEDEAKFLKDAENYDDYKSMSAVNYEGPHQIETIQSKSYHKKVPYLDISDFEHKSEQKHGEVHYHQHKHMHKHEHKQEHVHQHKQEHKHEHGHKHQHHQEHKHEHHQKHKHEHHQEHKHEHHQEHKHEHHHGHKHKQHHEHKHDHHQEHKHDHHHGHKHDHHQEHKHEHHQEHKHDHHHGHKHEHHQEHKHEHHQDHKHDHHHKHGHKHKHHQEHKHDHHQEHKHDHHHKHGHKHGHKHSHNHKHGHKHSHHKH